MLKMIIKDLRLSPMRSILTSLSMAVGILSLITSVLIGTTGKDYLQTINAQLSGWSPTYTLTVKDAGTNSSKANAAFLDSLEHSQDAAIAAEYQISSLGVYQHGKIQNATFLIASSNRSLIYPNHLISGIGCPTDNEQTSPCAVVNEAANNLYTVNNSLTIGQFNSISTFNVRVRGVVSDGSTEPVIYMNPIMLQTFFPLLWTPSSITLRVHPHSLSFNESEIKQLVNDMLFDTVGGSVTDTTRTDNAESYDSIVSFLQAATLVSALLLLTVSTIGIINIGMAGIEQRARELLIRRALGATRLSIVCLVVGSSVMLSLFVALGSIIISLLIVGTLPVLLPAASMVQLQYPVSAAIIACAAAVATAALGALAPAIKAARLQPALALR
ncbi:ABC transporter permease [Bifidobacterium parmae]|uniref:ABC transporter substrate-binding protein n=1 Tax=Bifidobacterium parmae TaxID=361854 RepID=A0A2N5J6C2_9BIFI|nr:FtsX-like permease family protein [Bifidobacterium parmae]PLS29753.1 ABC transporter substrate-binding protein [Bifidobacterium parmae]